MDHIAQIAGKLADHQLDAMLLASQAGERYAEGFHGEGLVLVTREGAHYSTDSRYIEAARQEGMTITCDQYPYTATSTSMTALVPKWAHDGGRAALLERLRDPSRQLKAEIAAEMEDRGGADRVMIAGTHGCRPEWEGRTVAELAEELGLSPVDTVMHVLSACEGSVACIYFSIDEGDMLNIMKDMDIAVGSDGYGLSFDRTITITDPHPRSFGTFPRFLRLVREHQLMPLEDAVYKLTGLPADILGLRDRGTLAEGRIADITVFDAERVRDTSEFTDSVRKPEGICHVLVGGEFALRQGRSAGGRKGAVIRRESGGPV